MAKSPISAYFQNSRDKEELPLVGQGTETVSEGLWVFPLLLLQYEAGTTGCRQT